MALSQVQLKRLTAIHGWSGVVLGLLLYAVIATGTVAVFAAEIGRWSAGAVRFAPPLDRPIDTAIRKLATQLDDPAQLEDIGIWGAEGPDFFAFFHTHAENPDTGTQDDFGRIFRVDGVSGAVLGQQDGFVWHHPAAWDSSALRRFLVDLHVQLYLPEPWGLIVTGILGLMMMAAVVSGVLIHRHVIRDLFVAERPGGRLAGARDRHVLAASWSLPFAFLLAFTGSFFSFASSIGFPLVAAVAFGGDQEQMSATLFEPPVPEDAAPLATASLDAVLADSRTRAPGPISFVDIARFDRADARIHVWHDPAEGGMLYVTNVYDAHGEFLGRQAPIGTAPSAGGALYGLMYPLHYGHFAGLASKALWGALGVTLCHVVLSGLRMQVRRRQDLPVWRGFGRAVQIFGYGLPIGMIASAWAFFLTRPAGDPFHWTPIGFVIGTAIAVAIGLWQSEDAVLHHAYGRLLGIACLLLPVLRVGTGGMDWARAILEGQSDVLTVDLLLLLAGAVLLYRIRGARLRSAARPEPAE